MKKITLLALLMLSIVGCSEKDDENINGPIIDNGEIIEEPVLGTFEITSKQSSVKPLEFVIISSSDISFNKESYKGSINSTEIDLVKTEDNELIFTVPSDFNTGSAKLELIIDNKKGELSFDIIENSVQNVDNVISNELITPLSDFENELDFLIAYNIYSDELTTQMESAKQMITDYKTKFNTLSNEEKLEVAKFFNANPIFTTDFLNLASKTSLNGDPNWDCLRDNKAKIVLTTASIVAFVKLIVLSGSTPIGPVAAVVGVTAGIYAVVTIASTVNENVLNNCFAPIYNSLNDADGNDNNFEIDNNLEKSFSIITSVRNVISSDINSDNEILSTLVSKLNYIKSKFSSIKSRINNNINNATGWFNEWFGTSAKYKQITYEFEELPDSSDEYEINGNTEYITIDDFPSDVEVEYTIVSDNSINLKFKADESTLPRTVKGKIKYNDGDFSNEKEFTVNIEPLEFDYEGTWLMTWYYDDGTISQYNKITFNENGEMVSETYNIPRNNSDWAESGYTFTMSYDGTLNIYVFGLELFFLVDSFDQTNFDSVEKIPNGTPKRILVRQ